MAKCGNCTSEITGSMHVVEGVVYCDRECAIDAIAEGIRASAHETAIECYEEDVTIIDIQQCACSGCTTVLNDQEIIYSSEGMLYCSPEHAWEDFGGGFTEVDDRAIKLTTENFGGHDEILAPTRELFEGSLEAVRSADIGLCEEVDE